MDDDFRKLAGAFLLTHSPFFTAGWGHTSYSESARWDPRKLGRITFARVIFPRERRRKIKASRKANVQRMQAGK